MQENLELAYAISVHKSQGSEFDYVYIIIPKRDSHLLSMELLYTAVTRAQKKVTVLLQEDMGTLTSLGHIENQQFEESIHRYSGLSHCRKNFFISRTGMQMRRSWQHYRNIL